MRRKKTIVIAEDHRILREGLKALLFAGDELELAGEAEDGLGAIRCVEQLKPDLLLLDLSMPRMSGISVIKDIKTRYPETKILILTIHETEEYILEALRSGAEGYCLKDAGHKELLAAVRRVLDGKTYLSPDVSQKVLQGYLEERKTLKDRSSWDTLTQREREVLKLVGEGHKNKEIAELLCISPKTVEKHRSNLMRKLDLHSVSALTAFAIEKGLVTKSVRTR